MNEIINEPNLEEHVEFCFFCDCKKPIDLDLYSSEYFSDEGQARRQEYFLALEQLIWAWDRLNSRANSVDDLRRAQKSALLGLLHLQQFWGVDLHKLNNGSVNADWPDEIEN